MVTGMQLRTSKKGSRSGILFYAVPGWTPGIIYLAIKGAWKLLLVHQLEMLDIDGFLDLLSSLYGWLYECLPCAKLADSPGLLEFPLELLESLLDVLSFFDRNNNHSFESPPFISGCKGK